MAGLVALDTSTGRLNECSSAKGGVIGKFESLDRLDGQQPACGQHQRCSGCVVANPEVTRRQPHRKAKSRAGTGLACDVAVFGITLL